jgi:(1->4)-alpha-D-glucan 1-alpha-D-glucosylmutase
VDPDNRRTVDYEVRRQALTGIGQASPEDLLACWKDSRIKLVLTHKLLQYRRGHFDLFAKGDYLPVQATGIFSDSAFAFARRHEGNTIVVIAPRLSARVGFPPIGDRWQDTALDFHPDQILRDIFTGRDFSPRLSESLEALPFAAFVSAS